MDIGIFARTFPASGLEGTLDAIEESGISVVHFNLSCAGLESLPSEIHQKQIKDIRTHFELRDLHMAAISGTFNAIHPDPGHRKEMTDRCRLLIEEAPSLGTHVVTLCTGTRDPENMWRAHSDNDAPEAWKDLVETLNRLVPVAEECGVVLGIEPEIVNVVDTAEKAKRLLDELGTSSLGIVLDAANLIRREKISEMSETIAVAVDILGDHILMAHAKDLPGEPGGSQAAGSGILDWETYCRSLQKIGFQGPLILHNLSPGEVDSSRRFVEETWRSCLEGGT